MRSTRKKGLEAGKWSAGQQGRKSLLRKGGTDNLESGSIFLVTLDVSAINLVVVNVYVVFLVIPKLPMSPRKLYPKVIGIIAEGTIALRSYIDRRIPRLCDNSPAVSGVL